MPATHHILFFIYVLFGPVVWALMYLGLALARSRMNRLLHVKDALPSPAPSVSVLVPAKNEGPGIRNCIERILALEYPGGSIQVVAIDDRSTDETGAILDQIARNDSRVTALHVPPGGLPEGWMGKCHALDMGSRRARGEWLLFVDSDVKVEPRALRQVLAVAVTRKYDAVSLLSHIECHGFWERTVLPLAALTWSVMFFVSLTNDDNRKESAFANGQFFLIRRSSYERAGGHAAVRDQIVEDVELMKQLKATGSRVRFQLGGHLASTRMHTSLKQMFNGWGRIYSGTSRRQPGRIIAAICFILVSGFTVYPAIMVGMFRMHSEPLWFAAAAAHFVLMHAYLAMMYAWSGNRPIDAIFLPISGSMLLAILGYSIKVCRTGKVEWRGTEVVVSSK